MSILKVNSILPASGSTVAITGLTLGGTGIVSGSSQIASEISGSSTSLSSSLAVDITTNTNSISALDGEVTNLMAFTGSAARATAISGSSTSLSSSLASRVTTEENNVDVLQAHQSNIHAFTASADSEITSLMGATSSYAAKTAVSGAFTSTSASIASDIASNLSNISSIGSFTASLDSDITTFSLPASTTISTFGKSLVDDADAATARTTLDVDQAGTDNSTNVTLVTTSHDYLSLAGQAITLGTVDISDDTNLAASTGITLTGDTLTTNDSQIVHDNLSGFVADEHVAHSGVSITAGAGLTGGGTIAATRTINVGAGTGVTVNADNVAIGQSVATTADVTFGSVAVTNDVTISGDLVVLGNATELQVSALNVEDINITIASGAADSAAANGAGITIAGANETLTWDHGNSRFSFSDDLNVTGNITLSGTVDGRDIASDGGKLDGIEEGADVTDTANVTAAGALMDSEVDADIKTLSLPASTTISTFGASLVDDADAATARTTLGLGSIATLSSIDISTNTNLAASTGITLTGDTLTTNDGQIVHDNLSGFVADEHIAHSTVSITAGAGLTGGGTIAATRTLNIGAGTGVTVNADDIAIGQAVGTSDNVQFNSLGVGTAGSATTGEIRATNDITAFYSSDERLKENIVTLDGALDKVKAMRGVTFDWKPLSEEERKTIHSHEGHDLGVIAQEVQAQYPELVHQREHGYLSVDYVKLTAVLIEAVKELSAKVDELTK